MDVTLDETSYAARPVVVTSTAVSLDESAQTDD
jgi:hypothetical protein